MFCSCEDVHGVSGRLQDPHRIGETEKVPKRSGEPYISMHDVIEHIIRVTLLIAVGASSAMQVLCLRVQHGLLVSRSRECCESALFKTHDGVSSVSCVRNLHGVSRCNDECTEYVVPTHVGMSCLSLRV